MCVLKRIIRFLFLCSAKGEDQGKFWWKTVTRPLCNFYKYFRLLCNVNVFINSSVQSFFSLCLWKITNKWINIRNKTIVQLWIKISEWICKDSLLKDLWKVVTVHIFQNITSYVFKYGKNIKTLSIFVEICNCSKFMIKYKNYFSKKLKINWIFLPCEKWCTKSDFYNHWFSKEHLSFFQIYNCAFENKE